MSLLWQEYCANCRSTGELPLMYTQFCYHYRQFALQTKATMHIHRKPGDQTEVDWAGSKIHVTDRVTGEIAAASIFVGVLSSSLYAYVETFPTQELDCWITAHVNMFKFFCGVTRMIVPDNLKTGVEKTSWIDPVINKTYQELAEHYGTAIIPARVGKPQDKPNVEGSVKGVSTWIIAAVRNLQFFSIHELNATIREKLTEFNARPFQKKPGSRYSVYLEEEQSRLLPLPSSPYELAIWKVATVQCNYHISLSHMHYSVPWEYIRHKVDVRVTRNVIEVFSDNQRICTHRRLQVRSGQYSTTLEHMPKEHQQYLKWDSDRFRDWARKTGTNTLACVNAILTSRRIEQQGYRSCMALLKLAEKHSQERLEAACCKAWSYTPQSDYRNIKTILTSGMDRLDNTNPPEEKPQPSHGYTRGAGYYGRNSK
ncbi:MAG: IS21 family transposase [Bacillota bacterium]